ncbi:hypothetical protein [Streptomyces sp. NPDC054863]
MYTEQALLDAREVRATLAHRTDALDEVKRLPLLPDGAHVTATLLADYFEVDAVVLRRVVRKHAGELGSHGYRQLQGEELRAFVAANMPQPRARMRQLGIFTVPAALVLAMVLDSSEVARVIRLGLLESVGVATGRGAADDLATEHVATEHVAAEGVAPGRAAAGSRLRAVEARAADAGSMFMLVGTPEQIADVLRRGLPT